MAIKWVAAEGSLRFKTYRSVGSKTQTMAVHEKQPSSSASVLADVYCTLVEVGCGDNWFLGKHVSCCHWECFSFCSAIICLFPQWHSIRKHYEAPTVWQEVAYRQGFQREAGSSPCPLICGVGESAAHHKSYSNTNPCPEFKKPRGGPNYPCSAGSRKASWRKWHLSWIFLVIVSVQSVPDSDAYWSPCMTHRVGCNTYCHGLCP